MYQLLDPKGIVAIREIPPREPVYGCFPDGIAGPVIDALGRMGVKAPYLHQAEAMKHVLAGRHLIITTGTASGKSLVYMIPAFSRVAEEPGTRVLYLTPTKALGQNQRHSMQELAGKIHWPGRAPVIAVCDGDTPRGQRQALLSTANFILTTPDFLHLAVLPKHRCYPDLFRNLKCIIIDEAHYYAGVLGNHFCHVLRRLRRICRLHGAEPVFILCSATIANPLNFAGNLTGLPHELVCSETSPTGFRTMVFYVPPLKAGTRRRNAVIEAARMVASFTMQKQRVIMFGRSRNAVELAYRKVLSQLPKRLHPRVAPYKGTYTPETRRSVEARLLSGELSSVLTTNALELGIDIGAMSVCVLSFPGSIASTWQQAGRVGRSGQDSLIVLIASEDPLEMYLVNHPDYFFGQPCENAVVNPRQLSFVCDHLALAAAESPLVKEDAVFWGKPYFYTAVKLLRDGGAVKLKETEGAKIYLPAGALSFFGLRGESKKFSIQEPRGRIIEQAEYYDILVSAYPGAILLSRGGKYLVKEIDYEAKAVKLTGLPEEIKDFSTMADIRTTVEEITLEVEKKVEQVACGLGEVRINRSLSGYRLRGPDGKNDYRTVGQVVKPFEMNTVGFWIDFQQDLFSRLDGARRFGSIHAVEHLLRVVVPWQVMCDRSDITTHFYVDDVKARLYICDNYSGGVGIAESLPDLMAEILKSCFDLVSRCSCKDGCPSCLHIPKCELANEKLDKEGAFLLLAGALNKKRDGRPARPVKKPQPAQTTGREGIKREARRAERGIKQIEVITAAAKKARELAGRKGSGPEEFRRLSNREKQISLLIFLLSDETAFVGLASIAAGAAHLGVEFNYLQMILNSLVARSVVQRSREGFSVWPNIEEYLRQAY